MSTHTWTAPRVLPPDADRAFADLLSYCFEAPSSWRRGAPGDIEFSAPDPAVVTARLDAAWRRAAGTPTAAPEILFDGWDRPSAPVAHGSAAAHGSAVAHELDWPGGAVDVGPGLQVAGPGLTRLVETVDRIGAALARDAGAAEYTVAHLLSWDTVRRAGYDRTFPQHLTTCATVRQDLDALDSFGHCADEAARAGLLQPAPVALSPAACLNLFAALGGRRLAEPMVLTARVPVTRYEAGAGHSHTRLWAYSVREIVYVGDQSGARAFRDRMLDGVADLLRRLDLPVRLQSAGDPFFSPDRRDLLAYQSSLRLKHELAGRLAGTGDALAVGSVNLHNQHFGQAFEIGLADGSPASSTCVGFGLDRFARWLYGHLGGDPANWPEVLRTA